MRLIKIEEVVVVTLLSAVVLLVFIAALLRWFGLSVAWSIDMAQLLFVWVCFIGADLSLRIDKHIGIDMLTKKFPLKVQNIIALLNNILIMAFVLLIFYYGTKLGIKNYKRHFNTMPISYSYVTFSAPFGCLLMALTVIGRIKKNIMNFIKNDYSSLVKEEKLEGRQII